MLLKIKFPYPVLFRKSSRCKKSLVHKAFSEFDAVIKDVSGDEFVLAGVLHRWDGATKEYRHYQDTFWVVDDEAPKRLVLSATYGNCGVVNEQDYREAMSAGTIVIEEDRKQAKMDEIQREADEYVSFDGHCWRKTGEPVFVFMSPTFNQEVHCCVKFAPKNVGHDNVFNAKDVDWHREGVSYDEKMDVIVPEVFHYGYDQEVLSETVRDSVKRFWPSFHRVGTLAPKLLEKAMPQVIERVSKEHNLPYIFTDDDVYRAMSQTIDDMV